MALAKFAPKLHHTMLRVKDPQRSHHFYSDLLGMTLMGRKDFPDNKFSLYFYGYPPTGYKVEEEMFSSSGSSGYFASAFKGPFVELTHNWGTEKDDTFKANNGNEDPKGFGHIALLVDDVHLSTETLRAAGVKVIKGAHDGRMKNIAFVADPDGYWVELLSDKPPPSL